MRAVTLVASCLALVACSASTGGSEGQGPSIAFSALDGAPLDDGDEVTIINGLQGGYWVMLNVSAAGLGDSDPDNASCGLVTTDLTVLSQTSLALVAAKADSSLLLPLNLAVMPDDQRPASEFDGAQATLFCDLDSRQFELDVVVRVEIGQ